MRHARPTLLVICLLSLSACAIFEAKQPPQPPAQVKELSVPVGKHWKVVEEPPPLTNERHERPAFQTEQSLLPEWVKRPTAAPEEKERKIETTR